MSSTKILAAPLVSVNVNPSKVTQAIIEGRYNTRPSFLDALVKKGKSKSEQATLGLPSCDDQEPRYTRTTLTGEKLNIVTTGVDVCKGEVRRGPCLYCRVERELILGICVSKIWNCKKEEFTYYDKSRRLCSPPCLISQLGYMHIPQEERSRLERDTICMLRDLYGQDYVPTPASDFELHEKNGGALTDEEWLSSQTQYTPVGFGHVEIIPVKYEFIAQTVQIQRER